jgi:hypothetical protein
MEFIKKLCTPLTLTILVIIPLAGYVLLYPLEAPNPPLTELETKVEEFERIMLTGYGHDTERKYIADIIYFAHIIPDLSDSDIILATPQVRTSVGRKSSFSLHGGPLHGVKDDTVEYYLFANEITQHYNPTWATWSTASLLYRTDFYILERNPETSEITIIDKWESSARAAGYLLHNIETNSLTVHICNDEERSIELSEDFTPAPADTEKLKNLCR